MIGQGSWNVFENNMFATMPEGVRPGGLMLTKRLVDYCNFPQGARTVDMGCGTGTTVEYLQDVRGLCAVGIDLSVALLAQGKERNADLRLIQCPGEGLPFTDHSVDGVLAECSLSIMPNVSRVLDEINRILIPGGKLGITDLYTQDRDCNFSTCGATGIMTYDELSQVLADHGFKIIVFEDQSRLLREFVAGFIMAHGSAEKLWECVGRRSNDQKKQALGYYLLMAEKCHRKEGTP